MQSSSMDNSSPPSSRFFQRLILTLLIGFMFVAFWDETEITQNSNLESMGSVQVKHNATTGTGSIAGTVTGTGTGTGIGTDPIALDTNLLAADDLSKASNLLERFRVERGRYKEKLIRDYGNDTYFKIFEPVQSAFGSANANANERGSIGRNNIIKDPFRMPLAKRANMPGADGDGWNRLVRKMSIKVLQSQIGMVQEKMQPSGTGTAKAGAGGLYTEFTWATGGHSSSAGHGNLFRESYTANMERAVKPILEAIGIDFRARNYGMGAARSGPEIALCATSIFGRDTDIVSWDYGMTDGRINWKMALYAYRIAGLSKIKDALSQPGNVPYRPALIGLHHSGGERDEILSAMHEIGMTTLGHDAAVHSRIYHLLPDTAGKSDQEIEALPPFTQYFRCDNSIESGDPGCGKNKFNLTLCRSRGSKTSWHPGWKNHALSGNLWAFALLDAFEDGAKVLVELEPEGKETPSELLDRLTSQLRRLSDEEGLDYQKIFDSPIPPSIQKIRMPVEMTQNLVGLLKDPAYCHTSILPAETRFLGLLTNSEITGSIQDQEYEKGVSLSLIESPQKPGDSGGKPHAYQDERLEYKNQLLLALNPNEREKCAEPTHLDFKDFYQISSFEGWKSLLLPNQAEAKYYTEYDATQVKGNILVCLLKCAYNSCPANNLQNYFDRKNKKNKKEVSEEERANFGDFEMKINGVAVSNGSMHYIHESCIVVRHAHMDPEQASIWKPNEAGKYLFEVRVANAKVYSYIRITSFIIL